MRRCTCADGHRMDPYADNAACEACDEVDEQVAYASKDNLDERPDEVEHVHVHANVDDAEVQKAGGEQTPPLVGADGGGAESPPHFSMSRGVGSVREMPLATMARKTRTLIAISAIVMV